jgi:alcohol dehydrogenase class IV
VAFASAGSGLHHKICHVLGGMFGLPHAQTHAVVLPHVLAVNGPAVPEVSERVADALGTSLVALLDSLDAPEALRELGFAERDIAPAVEVILPAVPPSNPRPVTAEDMTVLLRAAWEGS